MCQNSVNLRPSCIKFTARSFRYKGAKIDMCRKIIHGTNVAQSPVQTKKQGNKKSSGGGGWTQQGKGGCIKWREGG